MHFDGPRHDFRFLHQKAIRILILLVFMNISQATSNALPYAWDVLSSSHITPSIVAKAFHSAGVGLRHMGYAAHLAAFNNSHPFLATLFEKMIIARCCKVLLRTKLLQHIADHSEDNSDSNGLPPRRHGGFSGVAIAQDDAPMPQAEDGMAEVGPPNDDGSWESLDEDFEVGIERVPEAAPGTPPSGGSVAESHTPCDSGAPTPRAKDSELRRSTQVRELHVGAWIDAVCMVLGIFVSAQVCHTHCDRCTRPSQICSSPTQQSWRRSCKVHKQKLLQLNSSCPSTRNRKLPSESQIH